MELYISLNKAFEPVIHQLQSYFDPLYSTIEAALWLESVEGPILNVLRKCYQNNWRKIYAKCFTDSKHRTIMKSLQGTLKLADGIDETINDEIVKFIEKLSLVWFKMYISDPWLIFDLSTIGQKVSNNPVKMDSMDGFIKNGQESLVILPSVHKNTKDADPLIKPNILPLDYEFP